MTNRLIHRRRVIGGLLLMPLLVCGRAADAGPAGPTTNVVDAFGFVPDGRTDNHDAFHRWADHVNRVGGGAYVFPPGDYAVRRYRSGSTPPGPLGGASHAEIRNSNGLVILGEGARIRLNGRFHRPARPFTEGITAGHDMGTFMPFLLTGCRNVVIQGFEVDGGVREMSRDPEVYEAYAHLIALHGCSDVLLENLDLHHSQTDSVFLSGDHRQRPSKACRNIRLRNVRCRNNGRGGLAIIQVLGVSCTDCEFSGSGTDLGRYEGHLPRFGVDIEPDYAPLMVDVRTGNIAFHRCEFHDNATAIAAVYSDRFQGYLRLIDCRSTNRQGHEYPIMINWPGALIEGGVHDGGRGTIYTSWDRQEGGDLTIRNCEFRTSAAYGILHAHPGNIVHFENVRIIGEHVDAAENGWVLGLRGDPGRGRRNSLRNCEIFIPRARKSRTHAYDYEVTLHHSLSEANRFVTDLPAGSGAHFCTEYGPGAAAVGDQYEGTARGRSDSFRPAHGSEHDSRQRFSRSPN